MDWPLCFPATLQLNQIWLPRVISILKPWTEWIFQWRPLQKMDTWAMRPVNVYFLLDMD